mgnify:CR=1 FL=1|tara:strand:- start:493 stop:687 length:195 start_codon:yes stop_codon:yes gene_type:complete
MNEEVNAVLQVYQNRINTLTAQNIAFEAKILTLQKQVQSYQEKIGVTGPVPEAVDGGELEEKTE